jgi:hypothetical protein
MDMLPKLPSMTDEALKTLQSNAERLEHEGNPAQRAAAVTLLPAIRATLEARRAAVLLATPPKTRAKAKPKAKVAATSE